MKRSIVAVATALCVSAMSALAATEDKPDATVELSGGKVGVGVGVTWAKGTLHFEGREIPVTLKGLSVANVGGGSISATGNVYHLKQASDFAGNYAAVSAGAALGGGGAVVAMTNEKGVVIQMRSTTVGADFDLGVKGMQVSLKQQ